MGRRRGGTAQRGCPQHGTALRHQTAEKRSREGKPRADRPHGNNNRRKSDASYEVCDYSQKRLSPVLKDDDNVVQREEADNKEQQSVSNNPRREEEEYREASPFDTGASEIGRKLASTNIGGNS